MAPAGGAGGKSHQFGAGLGRWWLLPPVPPVDPQENPEKIRIARSILAWIAFLTFSGLPAESRRLVPGVPRVEVGRRRPIGRFFPRPIGRLLKVSRLHLVHVSHGGSIPKEGKMLRQGKQFVVLTIL